MKNIANHFIMAAMGNSLDDLVCIHRVYETIEAELIKSHLEVAGIPAILKADNAGGSLSYLTSILGIEIIVRREDAERAHHYIHSK